MAVQKAKPLPLTSINPNLDTYFQNNEIFKNAFQYSAIGMALVSLEGKWLKVNPKVCEIVGYPEEELLQLTFQDITHPDDLDLDLKYVQQMVKGKIETYGMEKRYFHKNGKIVWVLLSVSIARDINKTPLFFISQIKDITERKLASESLIKSEKRYRDFFDNSPISLWEEDLSEVKKRLDELKQQGVLDFRAYFASHPDVVAELASHIKILDVNQAALKLYGAKNKEELFSSSELRSIGEIENNPEDFIAIAEGKTNNSWDGSDETISGEPLEISLSWSVIAGHEHDYSRVIVTTFDITERKRVKEELQASKENYRNIVEDMPMMMCRFKVDGTLTFINTFYCQYFKKSYAELLGSNLFDLIPAEERDIVKLKYLSLNQEKPFITYEYKTVDLSGKINWQRWTDRALFNEKGQIIEYQSIGEDITEQKRTEILLQNENKVMEMIASGADLNQTLDAITKNVESFLQNTYCSILLLDKDGIHLRHGAAPSLPKEYIHAVDGIAIGENAGSCGTAAFRKEPVIVTNIATDPLWVDYKELALKHKLQACWSTPIMSEAGAVYGTFAIYYSELRDPKKEEFALINQATHQAKIVIEQKQVNAVREESERRYRSLFEDSPISLWEEDFSGVKKKIDELKQVGITDFEEYFSSHPQIVFELAAMVKILNVNKASVELYNAKSKDALTVNMLKFLRAENVTKQFIEELIQIAKGKTHFEREELDITLSGEPLVVSTVWSAMPGHEEDLSRVIVSIVDITQRKQAEEERRILVEKLGERVKELTYLHNISHIFMDDTRSEFQILQAVANAIPPAWQYPEITAARVGYNGHQFTTPNFKQTDWMLSRFFELPYGLLGVVQVAYLEERPQADNGPFLKEEVQLLESTVEKLRTYIKGILADQAMTRQLTELETLYESGLKISQLLTPKGIAQEVIGVLARRMNWHHIAIREYDQESNSVKLIGFNKPNISANEAEEYIQNINSVISNPTQGLSGWVTTHGKSVRVPNVNKDERFVRTFPDISSGLYVPLKIGERVIGSISVESEVENGFSENDERLLITVAGQAAIAIENANLFNELEKRVQERTIQIETTKRRLELATHAGQIGVWEYIPRENKAIWDERMHIIHHVAIGEFDGTTESWAKHIHPEDLAKSQINSQLAFTENLLINNEHRIIWKDGSIHYLATSAVTVFAQDNTPDRIIGICRDITERKQIEQNLEDSEAYARLLFDAAPDPVFVTQFNGMMVDANQFFEIQHQIKREDLKGKHISELEIFPPEELEKAKQYMREVANGNNIPSVELKFNAPNNNLHTLELHSYSIESNGVRLILSTSRDITSHKKLEEALKLANAEMENALKVKDEFLANMSHELRTPLNAILGISESLEEQIIGQLNDKQSKYVGIIKESGKHLLELINDILDISKIEAGRMELTFYRISVEKLCQASLRMIKELAQKKNIQVSFKIKGEVNTVMGDERRLKQVLVNLLSNAVKFTEEGKQVGLEVIGYPENNEVAFSVWDTGIGIAQEDLKFLFKPFVQLDASLAREYQGTGLGLALVAQMVRLHGGLVSANSELGKGSMFTITLPWQPEEQNAPVKVTGELVLPNQRSEGKRKGKVLLVEDTDVIISLIKDYLTFKGYEVIVANNGRDGILLAKEKQPDIILMDVMMPIMDGVEATKQIRAEKGLKLIPIIALTALAMPGDRERCLKAGMNDYMSKPVKLNELIEIIEKYIAQG